MPNILLHGKVESRLRRLVEAEIQDVGHDSHNLSPFRRLIGRRELQLLAQRISFAKIVSDKGVIQDDYQRSFRGVLVGK